MTFTFAALSDKDRAIEFKEKTEMEIQQISHLRRNTSTTLWMCVFKGEYRLTKRHKIMKKDYYIRLVWIGYYFIIIFVSI